ncbi:hypothetical protein LGZ99_22235 [Photorhabdus temperata]|uniref:Uncharacterized protein n=1 Tax=Photorhabdus temperata subsp. temperata Meg1 TaxID=1393735 RepID=A0A081RQK7_PHOTE|nr:hypothetical protein [Photorhabdus temperata]KER00960.1 hypothetical protein MEG1DRAFT_04441 [Photorhabdus temperata subsp. temperata Meg1]MCT8349845.1 hypothetical protein [Photorhabdus temperata]
MLSVNMKSAVCDCKIPDPCIHKLTLKVGKRVFVYNQIEPIGDIWVVDEAGGIFIQFFRIMSIRRNIDF